MNEQRVKKTDGRGRKPVEKSPKNTWLKTPKVFICFLLFHRVRGFISTLTLLFEGDRWLPPTANDHSNQHHGKVPGGVREARRYDHRNAPVRAERHPDWEVRRGVQADLRSPRPGRSFSLPLWAVVLCAWGRLRQGGDGEPSWGLLTPPRSFFFAGELCSLRYDLTVPFARYLAMNRGVSMVIAPCFSNTARNFSMVLIRMVICSGWKSTVPFKEESERGNKSANSMKKKKTNEHFRSFEPRVLWGLLNRLSSPPIRLFHPLFIHSVQIIGALK